MPAQALHMTYQRLYRHRQHEDSICSDKHQPSVARTEYQCSVTAIIRGPAGPGLVSTGNVNINFFLGARQEATRTVFCNYLARVGPIERKKLSEMIPLNLQMGYRASQR